MGDFESAASFNDRDDGRNTWSGLLVSDVDPVFAPQCHWPNGVLGGVGTQLQDGMIQEASQPVPQRQSVVASFGQSALGQ